MKNYSNKGFTGAYVSGYSDAMAKVRSVLARAIVSERKCRDTARRRAEKFISRASIHDRYNEVANLFDTQARDLLELAKVATDND